METIIIFDYFNTLYNPLTKRLFPGTVTFLLELKEVADLYLITTENSSRKAEIINFGLNPYFKKIIFCIKKEPLTFSKLLKRKSRVVIVGDRIDEEIAIAKELNTPFVLVNPNKENPILTIKRRLPYPL